MTLPKKIPQQGLTPVTPEGVAEFVATINTIIDYLAELEAREEYFEDSTPDALFEKRLEDFKFLVSSLPSLQIKARIPKHGNCCTCQKCGYDHEVCECERNAQRVKILGEIEGL